MKSNAPSRLIWLTFASAVFALAACSQAESSGQNAEEGGDAAAAAETIKQGRKRGEEIVFVAPSRSGTGIRAAKPDGSAARQIFSMPDYAPNGASVWELAASPDGRRIAFASDHDWDRSMNLVNVYVVDADGRNLKRPSNAPSIPELDDYKTGKVTVDARRLVRGGTLSAYVLGAREPVSKLLREGQSTEFVLEAADLGPDIRQYVRIFNHDPGPSNACHFDPAVQADVKRGKTQNAGEMPMLGTFTCPRVWSPGWIDNETLAVMYAEPSLSISPDHNIWTVKADIKPGQTGERWLNTSRWTTTSKLTRVFAGEADGDEPTIVAFQSGATASGVHAAPAADPSSMTSGYATVCGDTITCKMTSIDSTPDGGITIISAYARTTGPDFSAIYLSRGDGSFEQVVRFTGEAIGTAAISPDGEQIVFDRSRGLVDSFERVNYGERIQCPCSLWVMNADGSGLKQIVEDGRSPDWSR